MKRVFFVIAASIVLVSCVKEGPAGPRGPQGRDGKDGKDGIQMTTRYFKVYYDEWEVAQRLKPPRYYCFAEKSYPALTSAVIDQGAVLVYALLDGCDQQLPYVVSSYDDNGYYTRVIRYDLQEGIIGFVVEDSDLNTPLPPFGGDVEFVEFKVVIIK